MLLKGIVVIMATIACSFRIEEETKKQLDDICTELGMSTSTAFSLFARRMVAERGLPFPLKVITAEKPQETLLDALHMAQELTAGNNVTENEVLSAVMERRCQ
jgi:DNA-damage-inducible protein J